MFIILTMPVHVTKNRIFIEKGISLIQKRGFSSDDLEQLKYNFTKNCQGSFFNRLSVQSLIFTS